MKCRISTCGAEGPGEFCHICGTKKVDASKDNAVVSCNGKLENGNLCQAQLVRGQKFCMYCGKPVDQSLFDIQNERCSNCDAVLAVGKPFCAECGHQRLFQGQSKTDDKLSGESTAEKEVLLESNPVSYTATRNEGYSSEIKKEPILAGEEEGIHTGKEDIKGHEEHNKTSGKEIQDANNTQNQSDGTDQVVAEENRSLNKEGARNELNVENDSVETSFKQDSNEKKFNSSDDSKDSHSDATDPIKDKTLQNEEEKGSVTMDSEDDSEFDIGETKDCGGAASLCTDNDLGSGTLTGKTKKKQKKNKKKRMKDRDLSKQDNKTDDGKSKSKEIDETKSESKQDIDKTSDMTQANPNDGDGRVFGQAQTWKTPEKVETSKPNDSSIFNTSSSYDAQGNATTVQDDQKVQDDPKIDPEKDKSTDEEKSSSEDDNDNDNRGIQEKDGNEQLPNENQESVRETNAEVKETDIDTGQTVHIPETQTKRKKKRKKKKKNKDKATVDASSTTQSKGVNTRSMTRNANEEWSVTFHVLTSEDFHFDTDKYQVFIVMGHEAMGGWNSKSRQMKVERHVEGGIYELVYETKIPFRLIDGSNYFPYKYYFKKKDMDGKYEFYKRRGQTGHGVNRVLIVNQKYKSFGEWHKYDGFAERELSRMDKMKEMLPFKEGKFNKHAEKAIQEFCPQLSDLDKVGFSNILQRIQMLYESLQRVYYLDVRCWSDNHMEFVSFFGKYLVQAIIALWKIDRDQSTATEGEREQILNGCILVVCVLHILNINLQDSKLLQKLCKAMLIRKGKEGKQCQEYQFIEKNFQESRQSILEALLSLVKTLAGTTKDPSWLYIMPWVHFLSGESSPFEAQIVDVSHDSEKPVWWGNAKIVNEVKYFKAKSGKWAISFEAILEHLEPLFEMDHLLPRTLMTAVDLDDLEKVIITRKIPTEICLATVTYYVKVNQPQLYINNWTGYYYFPIISLEEKKVSKCIESLLNQLKATVYSDTCSLTQWTMCYVIAGSLFEECVKADRSELFCSSLQTLVHCLAMFDRCMINKGETVTLHVQNSEQVMNVATLKALTWMENYQNIWICDDMEKILVVWNSLFAPEELQSERVRDEWNKIITENLAKKLNHVCTDSARTKKFVELHCKKVHKFNLKMQDCMTKAAFQAISNGYSVNYNSFSRDERIRYGELLSDTFISEWKKHVKTTEEEKETSVLKHVLMWTQFLHYLDIYHNNQKDSKILKHECVESLEEAVRVIADTVTKLHDGSITIGDLDLLVSRGKAFSELSENVWPEREYESTVVTKVLQLRQREVKAFKTQAEEMSTLASLCQHLTNVDIRCVADILQKQKDINRHSVWEFCVPADEKIIEEVDQYVPKLCAFDLPQTVLHMVPLLHVYSKSRKFINLWQKKCVEVVAGCGSLEHVVQKVWTPVKESLDEMSVRIQSGEIQFREFEKRLGEMYGEDYGKMEAELKHMNVKDIKLRLDQLKKYRQLSTCVEGAKTILEFAQEYNLNGDFDQMEVIATQSDNDLEMRSFDDSVMKVCGFLSDMTPAREACLKTFVTCEPLVKWLKTSMEKEGLKELKVFVDLAIMSAGEEGLNIARVQCLHSAVTGYAPLIFDLQPTSGYEHLLKLCSFVWKELDANPNLPAQLKDTNHNLEWFKEIKKAHGSVEVTSLMQVEAINAKGVFTVGKNVWNNESSHGTLLMISDTLRLTVLDVEGQGQDRNYTFHQLQDLHSRLMLVAGKAEKGNDNVERFTMIFDSTIRLSNVYMKLCSSGCVLFKNWSAMFFCDPNLKPRVCIKLKFGQGKDVPQLKGRKSYNEDLKDMIPKLANVMENCYTDWLKHIQDKRKNHLHLNYFTIDQLVVLQRELVKIGTETQPDLRIYPLLSAVKANCTPDDVLEAMTDAKREIDGYDDIEPDELEENIWEDDDAAETLTNATEDEKKENFIQELVLAGYNEDLALRAAVLLDLDDLPAGIIWCMEQEMAKADDVDQPQVENQPMGEQVTQRPTFTGWSQSETDIQTMITTNISGLRKRNDFGSAPLINELTALWKQFLDSISSNIRDYLSLEHLGLILKHLARKDTNVISRSLPLGYKEGEPNLIMCPSEDVLMTTLSIYMMDRDQPLPQSDEILMCTPNTTKDEVDIFWRRAIFDGGRKIHCLVNADMLDYDVSEAAERCLEEYLLEVYQQEFKYRLFVICGSDNEYRSTIVSSLDKFKRQPLPANTSHLRDYLANKLIVQEQALAGVRPAACVDRQRSTVRVIKSWRAGVGKTLFKHRREEELSRLNRGPVKSDTVSIPLQEKTIDLHYVIERLLEHTTQPGEITARLFHIDVAHEVENGVDYLLFNLLVLGCLTDKTGFVWRKSPTDIYLIETMPLMMHAMDKRGADLQYVHPMLNVLPDLTCRSPQDSLQIYDGVELHDYKDSDQLFDEKQFRSPVFQRTFQYLLRLDQGRQLDDVKPDNPEGHPQACLQTLLRHCGLEDPSWSELHHFVWFLNTQLVDFENNMFVSAAAAEDLPGFSKFVLRFLIQMSRDFSTRSLKMSEESPGVKPKAQLREERIDNGEGDNDDVGNDLEAYQMRRTWESSPHPYLFFNSDRLTFTFLGFFIDRASGNLIDQQTRTVLETGIMAQNLYDSLVRNHAPIQENFDALPRDQKITKLCNVMGIEFPHDPDDTYELTTDNVKKIMAIYMRFRCDIPVIIMGETGCGKTRLVKFMCSLQQPPGVNMTNMILMKVHGGTTHKDIIKKVKEAEKTAQENKDEYGDQMYTVLFFDEANTTEAIGLIKEIMCDKSMEGKKLKLCENLKMVAACNPYRKHSEELIKKLEQAGLGYHVDADETTDRLGRVPMRRLVYRVQPLPQSLLPLVWDFGQLNTEVEDLYIRQMVRRYIRENKLPGKRGLIEVVSAILTASQEYMRAQKDECSFVSLRDVDRVLTVMSWFYQQSQGERTLYDLMDEKLYGDEESATDDEDDDEDEEMSFFRDDEGGDRVDDITRSLILALGVCYHACLKTRPQYRAHIAPRFRAPCHLSGGADQIQEEIECCQEVFLDNVHLEKNIARNMALRENVFMMVVCIELRIPLFLVGKPGSSKSLAKTIVSDAMQGNAAREELFRELKQAQMVSFQCSPLATPDGIVGTFRQCAQFQKDKDLDTFVSIVVLDEVGLAEDSPRMPLKTLHPLLEDGCQGDEKPETYKKVAFIGISNWALDPAKMNRGILVQREVPDIQELVESAIGICNTTEKLGNLIKPFIQPLADSYLEIFQEASLSMREFYGLRDFYSLVKMVYGFVEKSKQKPTWHELLHSIKRNFGGLDQVDPVESFRNHLTAVHFEQEPQPSDPDCSPAGLVQACLFDTNNMKSESRYLLLLTENYGTLTIIQQQILSRRGDIRPITIFGSSFRSDQEYTQVCRNINKIKVCMETGNTVVLLNLENLYESLYDALNQYYVYFGGERYVDLGLGTHRVKCTVHKDFRLIVVAEKQTVYKKFPIPLINRLEKHFLTINTMLSQEQQQVVDTLENWAKEFVKQRNVGYAHRGKTTATKVGDVFIGYHDDTCSAIVLDVWNKHTEIENVTDRDTQVLQESKSVLLWCATPESLIRLEHSTLSNKEKKLLNDWYSKKQQHDSLLQYLNMRIVQQQNKQLFAQITTHSKLMAGVHKGEISKATGIDVDKILLLETLSSFVTEQQFSNKIQKHIQGTGKDPSLMVIQCDSGDMNANLIACARYCIMDELEKMRKELQAPVHVVFIVQLPRGASFTGFQCGLWHSAHIDDLYPDFINMPTIQDMKGKSISKLLTDVYGPSNLCINENIPHERLNEADEIELNEEKEGYAVPKQGMDENFINTDDLDYENRMGNAPLQLDDADESFDKSQHKLNVKGLILSCVQAALSMVKDKVENTNNKETDRVGLVLKLLHKEQVEGQASFLHGVCCLIIKLLSEKESKMHGVHMAQYWLVNEAASKENIHKAGTFRRSCVQTLETKIVPILAGVIAYLDTNDNLNILQEDHLQWKEELWFTYLNTTEAISLQYTDLQSPKRQSDLTEVVVMTTGCEGQMFSARMPFSWLLINKINEILKLHHPVAESHDHKSVDQARAKTESSVKVLSEHALGKVLSCITKEHDVAEAVQEYIYDFVHTMYRATSDHEQQLVCQSVLYLTTQMANNLSENSLLHSLVTVHIAYQKLAPRLTYFRAMNSVWPECSTTIVDLKASKPDHFMFKEQEFTFSALCLLLENLTPKGTDLNSLHGRSHWLSRVHSYRPVVEKVISLHGEDPTLYGAHSIQSVRRAKGLWSRVMVVKLFLEHVCAFESEDKITIKHFMPLWKILGEEANMKEKKSLEDVEKFLKICNKQAMKEYIGDALKCCDCEAVLEGPPITLPCQDILCNQCYAMMKVHGVSECAKCCQHFNENWEPVHQIEKKNDIEKLKDYQKRCNTFFMDVVSQLCFADNTAPSQEVVEKLLSYIFFTTRGGDHQRTRDLSIFNTGIDPTPVFRSFLLQLLMRTSADNVKENLEHYLSQAKDLIQKNADDEDEQYVELCLLVIQCLEDMFTQEASRADVDEIKYACDALHRANQNITKEGLNVEKLYGLASARMGLAITARCVAGIVMNNIDPRHVDRRVRKLIEAAQRLYEEAHVNWTRKYLVKHICRCYSIDVYYKVCQNPAPFLRWISMRDVNSDQVVEVSDRYIICGDNYTRIREAITKVILGENVEHLFETVQELQAAGVRVEPMLQLAVHREITSSYLYPQQQRKLKAPAMETLNIFAQECEAVKNKSLMQLLMTNELVPRHLVTVEGEDLRLQGIQCLIVHYLSVMMYVKGDRTLLQPLQSLMMNPQACVEMLLPTMPQDDLEDIRNALLDAEKNNENENPVVYRCPNGHPYVIGDCGRPYVVSKCKCGAVIGGKSHVLEAENTKDTGRDSTLTGYILGQAQTRGKDVIPERTLTLTHTVVIRLILHMSIFIGVGKDLQGVQSLIKPDIDINGVEEFLWAHIQQDIDDIHRALGRSIDDVLLLMHTIIDHVMKIHNEGNNVSDEVSQLSSKSGRNEWEKSFCANFLQTSLQNIENILKHNNQLLVQDHRLGADPLLCLLYEAESDTNDEKENLAILEDIPRVWRYRTPISLQHLRQEVEAKVSQQQHKVLQLFLKEDHHLRALRYIPSILRLHQALFQKYQRKLDKTEASQITVAQLKREEIAGMETNDLIQDFADAWELVRESLILYESGGMKVSEEYCNKRITDNTPVSVLLPTMKEAGLCSYILLDFLMRKQNDFLDKYLKEAHSKSGCISSVNPKEVTSAHLISYDPQHDILPLVLANCQYSFEMGKGTKIEYDFAALERQLMDRFLFSKSRIEVGRVLMIDQMIYRTEFTNTEVFGKLAEKITQERIGAAIKTQICAEIKTLPDICTSLDNLDITISFLKSTGGQPEKTLHEFMGNTLQMETTILSQKAQQACELRHAQWLWLLLSLQKSKKMVDNNQNAESTFESVLKEFHEELPEEVMTEYMGYMKKLAIDKLSQLVEILHEYILLVVAVRQNPEDEDFIDTTNHRLGEWLSVYIGGMDNPVLVSAVLREFPREILYKHSVHTWICSYNILMEKQNSHA